MREGKKILRVVEASIRSVLQFKGVIATAASFDPHRVAPLVWRGFCVVLEMSSMHFSKLQTKADAKPF
jgi:hypothetical protein